MKPGKVRAKAICVFRKRNRILVFEGHDSVKDQTFYRPLGGRIAFGERGHQTVAREIREEIGEDVCDVRYLGTLENIFTYDGQSGHEIMLIYDGAFVDKSVYKRKDMTGYEDDLAFKVVWKKLADFQTGETPLYPDGLLDLLTGGDS
jgi:hypothetical protein